MRVLTLLKGPRLQISTSQSSLGGGRIFQQSMSLSRERAPLSADSCWQGLAGAETLLAPRKKVKSAFAQYFMGRGRKGTEETALAVAADPVVKRFVMAQSIWQQTPRFPKRKFLILKKVATHHDPAIIMTA